MQPTSPPCNGELQGRTSTFQRCSKHNSDPQLRDASLPEPCLGSSSGGSADRRLSCPLAVSAPSSCSTLSASPAGGFPPEAAPPSLRMHPGQQPVLQRVGPRSSDSVQVGAGSRLSTLSLQIRQELARRADMPAETAAAHALLGGSPATNPRSVRHSLSGTPPPTAPPSRDASRRGFLDISRRGVLDTSRKGASDAGVMGRGAAGNSMSGAGGPGAGVQSSRSAPVRGLLAGSTATSQPAFPHVRPSPFFAAAAVAEPPSQDGKPISKSGSRLRALLLALHAAGARSVGGGKVGSLLAPLRRRSFVTVTTDVSYHTAHTSPHAPTPLPPSPALSLPGTLPTGLVLTPTRSTELSYSGSTSLYATAVSPPAHAGPLLVRDVKWYCSSDNTPSGGAQRRQHWQPHEQMQESPFAPTPEQRSSAGALLAARAAEYAAAARRDGSLARLLRQVKSFREGRERREEERSAPSPGVIAEEEVAGLVRVDGEEENVETLG